MVTLTKMFYSLGRARRRLRTVCLKLRVEYSSLFSVGTRFIFYQKLSQLYSWFNYLQHYGPQVSILIISNLAIPSNSDSAALSVPKLHDDGTNWLDYEPHIHKALGAKGLWAHVEGKATTPRPYQFINGMAVLLDRKTLATEAQIEARETKVIDYDKRKYLAQNDILSTMST